MFLGFFIGFLLEGSDDDDDDDRLARLAVLLDAVVLKQSPGDAQSVKQLDVPLGIFSSRPLSCCPDASPSAAIMGSSSDGELCC